MSESSLSVHMISYKQDDSNESKFNFLLYNKCYVGNISSTNVLS